MSSFEWLLVGVGVAVVVYLALIGALMVAGRRTHALALARFNPDCLVLLRRLLGDERVPRRRKLVLLGQSPTSRCRSTWCPISCPAGGPELLRRHWPGPDESLQAVTQLAHGRGER